jgi:hypothetical protein
MKFEKNIGKAERVFRIAAGVGVLALGFVTDSWLGLIGVVPIATAAIGWCPPYSLLGINTNKDHSTQTAP